MLVPVLMLVGLLLVAPVIVHAADDSPGKETAVPADETEFHKALMPAVVAYGNIVKDYNKQSGAESPWYKSEHAVDLSRLPVPSTPEEQELRRQLGNALSNMSSFRLAHQQAHRQAEDLLHKRGGTFTPLDKIVLLGLVSSVYQAHHRWAEAHTYLAEIIRKEDGILLQGPLPPPYLQRLREYARQTGAGQ